MRDTFIVINSFIHDMATGVWVAILFMMYIISDRVKAFEKVPQTKAFISGLMDSLWSFAILSIIVVIITGVIRSLNFKFYGWTGDVAKGRKNLLFIKHLMLGIAVTAGLILQFILMKSSL